MKKNTGFYGVTPSTQSPPFEGTSAFPLSAVAGGRALSGRCDPTIRPAISRPRPSPRYPGAAPSPDESKVERNRWAAADDIQAHYRGWVSGGCPSSNETHEIDSWGDTPLDKVLRQHLEVEVRRVLPNRHKRPSKRLKDDWETLTEAAHRRLVWATRHTLEVNPAVLARFAVEVAYDDIFRFNVAAVLAEPWPVLWEWNVPLTGGTHRLSRLPDVSGARLPISPADFSRLEFSTAEFAGNQLPGHNLVDPFESLRSTWPWAMDPIRPPVSAVRTTAAVIRCTLELDGFGLPGYETWAFGTSRQPVLGVELGHSVGAEALAVFLKGHKVHVCSDVFRCTGQGNQPDEFKAVVVNLPNPAAMAYVADLLRRHDEGLPAMSRIENDRYWRWPSHDQGKHGQRLVVHGFNKLAPGGVLIVLGDILSGQIHIVARTVESYVELESIPLWSGGPMAVCFDYSKKPWAPYGCIRPTGRILRAWRRVR